MKISFIASNFNSYGQPNYKKQLPQSPKINTLKADTCSFTGFFDRFKKTKDLGALVPKYKGIIYEKIKDENGNIVKKVPVEVDIIKDKPYAFTFMLGKKKIGELSLCYISKKECNDGKNLHKNYKNLGIVGDRIVVNFVENLDQNKYGGIGHLADLVEVACCKEMGFTPNVVSYSVREAMPLHYLRGKRFVPFKEYEPYYLSFYNNKNPDEIVENIIRTSKGKVFNTTKIMHPLLMYMPKDMIKKLEEELKEYPIF